MLILCTGMLRSASTWSYNVCRLLLEAQNMEFEGGFVGEGEEVDNFIKHYSLAHQNLLIKSHKPGPQSIQYISEGKAQSIYTYRDPRDSLCSGLQFSEFDFSSLLIGGVNSLRALTFYQDKSLFVRFDNVKISPMQEIERISRYLGFDCEVSVYEKIAAATSLESSKKVILDLQSSQRNDVLQIGTYTIDRKTLFHSNHIGSSKIGRWKDDLNSEEKLLVNAVFKKWLIDLEFEQYESVTMLIQTLLETVDWEVLLERYLHNQQYLIAGKLCESVVQSLPSNNLGYWSLGLSLFLAGNEETAKAVWMERLSEVSVLDVSNALEQLIEILIKEAKYWEAQLSVQTAYQLRLCVEEINPADLRNRLHVIQLALHLNQFDVSNLQELNILDHSPAITSDLLSCQLLRELRKSLSDKFPDNALVKKFLDSISLVLEEKS